MRGHPKVQIFIHFEIEGNTLKLQHRYRLQNVPLVVDPGKSVAGVDSVERLV